jgi:hypothetical protein
MRISVILSSLCLAAVIHFFQHSTLAGDAGPEDIVQKFFQASANGDVATMKELITGPFYKRRQRLLEENQGYGDFLKDHYFRVNTDIESIDINENTGKSVVVVSQKFQDGSRINTTLLLIRKNDGSWKINDELLGD